MKENGILLVVSDKESMLNDIPALCRLVKCELVKTFSMKELLLFIIKNKNWEAAHSTQNYKLPYIVKHPLHSVREERY